MHVDLRMMMRRMGAEQAKIRGSFDKKNAVTFMRREEIKGQKMKFNG